MQQHIFLVGCPRSGTTLFQSLLASHPELASFPETHFFPHLLPRLPWRAAGLVSRRAPKRLDAVAEMVGWKGRIRPRLPLVRSYGRAFVELLDTVAMRQGKSGWVEKSPEHLRHIDMIETLVPDAKFLHIIRNGADVAASLYTATNASWQGFDRPMTLEECVQLWIADVAITRQQLTKPNHFLVRYETLAEDPAATLRRVCAFLGLPFDERMLDDQRAAAERVILPWEHWKRGVLGPIRNANATKLNDTLTTAEREYALAMTNSVEIPRES